MKKWPGQLNWNHAVALVLVLAVHGGLLYGLWSVRVIPHPADAVTLFVNLISPPPPQPKPQPAPSPSPKPARPVKPPPREAPRPVAPPSRLLAAEAPVVSAAEATEALPPPAAPAPASPAAAAVSPAPAPAQPAGPVTLSSSLAMVCPERTPPPYPSVSRRLGETGKVVLRVELDETGRVTAAKVIASSGYTRLDEAALAAVRNWRCQPAQRDGQPVRSVAVQPFNFTLEGR